MKHRFVGIDEAPAIEGAAVVIDVLRAFSTAAFALHAGADRIILVRCLDEALSRKAELPGARALCDGPPRAGFDLVNSPAQVLEHDLTGVAIVQRTTAGTQGAVAARHASPLFCTGFVTARATAERLRGTAEVSFVVTDGDEDLACAEYISALLRGLDDTPRYLRRAARSPAAEHLRELVRNRHPGVDARDVALCLMVDRFDRPLEARNQGPDLVLQLAG
ncbi:MULTISPECIES: 2-phosphosulfolactate phosphatase [Micromonospora]|uniref:2-phosphosulfolactate phosphatase n=1 Tax=Micromonospora TaxID=1873 RepID=UPI001AE18994|nr:MULTISPECIES: 2-phosphosulfolactate phosphatase [unclassified Micromonospora]MBP1780664.1 2-phosphosulfolactate phosphatase [Micromonospora sp. HB375]MDH6468888.1 2-phosphosulfolactate phosphatase [Micromonospora sp. H404/HB375]